MTAEGHPVSHNAVYDLLASQGFTLQTNRKLMQSGKQHPDRNEQFNHISDTVLKYIESKLPVISIDCKKKENLGLENTGFLELTSKPQRGYSISSHDTLYWYHIVL